MPLFRTIRSGPFRLALLFAAIFAIGSIVLVVVIETAVANYAQQVTSDTLTTEAARLVALGRRHGPKAIVDAIGERAKLRQRPFVYLVTDRSGQPLAGALPRSADTLGWASIAIAEPATADDPRDAATPTKTYGIALAGGGHLIVGSDIYDIQELREWLNTVALWSGMGITFLSLIAGYLIASAFTNRLERLNTSISTIMGGTLNERVPVIGMGEEFDRLAANLNRMLDRIEALMTGVRQVSTDIAHDLRTPITRLRQHLESAVADGSAPVSRHVIEEALSQIDGIMTIFGALLRIGTIEAGAGRARFQSVDLSEVMQRVLLAYQPVAEDRGGTITGAIDSGVMIDGDADLLAQLFTNLIENVLSHTPPDTAIALALRRQGDAFVAEVCDNGPGIPVGERENVLTRFYRLDTSRTHAGAGLGLALVAAIADLHGAQLTLSDADPGLNARIEWPTAHKR